MAGIGPITDFKIVYGNQDGVYRSGDRLTGKLEISLKEAVTLRAIKLQFKGRSVWLGDSKKEGEVEKVYFNRDIVLLDRPPGKMPGDFKWEPGVHSLPFECPLPKSCETSYEGVHAFVRYFCRATVVQSTEGKEKVYVTKVPFTVLGPPPQSLDPELLRPVGATESVMLSGCCCMRGKVSGELTLQKSCFVPGETIYGALKVENEHPRQVIDQVDIRLTEKLSRGGNSKERLLMERTLEKSQVQARGKLNKESFAVLKVPSLAPSVDRKSQVSQPQQLEKKDGLIMDGVTTNGTLKHPTEPLFGLGYALEVKCGPKISLVLPITVGAVPLTKEDKIPMPTGFREFALGHMSVKESDDTKDNVGSLEFAPRYPVFEQGGTPEQNGTEV